MRVTSAAKAYVRKAVLAKVADRIKAAEDAAAAATASREEKVEKARKLCEKLCAEAQAKFVKEVKKLGLTFIPDLYRWNGDVEKGGNLMVEIDVDRDDFVETLTASRDAEVARCNPCAEREEFCRIADEPSRIRDAANAAAEKLLFELELGKVAKGELNKLLEDLEVEV